MAAAAARKSPARAPAPRRTTRAHASRSRQHRTGSRTPPGGHLIPIAVGRTAVAVRQLPDTRAIVGLTRGRIWIGVLGILLAGIVALNVATLSIGTTAGKIDAQIQTLRQENSVLRARIGERLSHERVQAAAYSLGLSVPAPSDVKYRDAGPQAIEDAARRLAAAG